MQHLGSVQGITKLSALPSNTERFRTIEINSFQLKDSLAFLNASLAVLVDNLAKDDTHTFPILDQMELYERDDTVRKQLLLRKGQIHVGVKPYVCVNCAFSPQVFFLMNFARV